MTFKFQCSPKLALRIQENDRIQIKVSGLDYKVMVTKATIGANFFGEIEATLDVAVEQDYSGWAV